MRYALGIKRELIAFGFGRCDRGFGFWGIALAKLNEVIAFGLVKYDCAFGLVECAIIFWFITNLYPITSLLVLVKVVFCCL